MSIVSKPAFIFTKKKVNAVCIITAFFFLQIFIAFGELFLSVNWAVVTDILLVSACETISLFRVFQLFST